MGIRFSGIASGLDTETMIKDMMKAQSYKKTRVQNQITLLDWKKEKWQDLNSKVYKLYTGSLAKMRLQSNYKTKQVTSSDEGKVTVTGDSVAAVGSHKLKIQQLASSQYVTSDKLTIANGEVTGSTKLSELGFNADATNTDKITLSIGGESKDLLINKETTLSDFVNFAKRAGINANFDKNQGRIFLSSANSGVESAFELTTSKLDISSHLSSIQSEANYSGMDDENKAKFDRALATYIYSQSTEKEKEASLEELKGYVVQGNIPAFETALNDYKNYVDQNGVSNNQLTNLKFHTKEDSGRFVLDQGSSNYTSAKDSIIEYNGVELRGATNTIQANGLTFTLKGVTKQGDGITPDEVINLTVNQDTKAVYDMVKSFLKEYNDLLGEMNTLYDAPSARGYDPLTAEEKEAMSDNEIELWEKKIKDSMFRRDNTVNGITSVLRSIISTPVEVGNKTYNLSSFGISSALYTEKGKLHIDGDKEDSLTAEKTDKLMAALSEDPETVAKVMSEISMKLYSGLQDKMKSSTLSSALTVYNDKEMAKTKEAYEKEVIRQEERLLAMEERYYAQFTAMEKALAQLNNQSSYLTTLLGTNSN